MAIARGHHVIDQKSLVDLDTQQLAAYKRFIIKLVRSERPDLTQRQFSVFLTVYMDDPPHTVRGLAARLNVSKPAITRALDRLAEFHYIRRKQDPNDRRSVLVQKTPQGDRMLIEIAHLLVLNDEEVDTT